MKVLSIEPTPNPNSMKLNMDESLADGVSLSFTREQQETAPGYLRRVLAVSGVRSVFQVADFIALERTGRADWRPVLAARNSDANQVGERP